MTTSILQQDLTISSKAPVVVQQSTPLTPLDNLPQTPLPRATVDNKHTATTTMPPPATLNASSNNAPSSSFKLSLPFPNPLKLRSYFLRLPLFTRLVLLVIVLLWVLELQTVWSVIDWGKLEPNSIGIFSGGMYRLNTYPVVHTGFWHMLFNLAALVGLMERFEMEWGTLNALALFAGPLSTIPAGLYILIERTIGRNTPILGASVWIFLLLAIEAIKTYRSHPYLEISTVKIPTWISPLALILVIAMLVPGTSFLGHLCGCSVGYFFGLGWLKFLAPPERVLRWIEAKLNLLGRLPHYVSVDQKTFGRYGVLPSSSGGRSAEHPAPIGRNWLSSMSGQRLGP